MLEAVFTNSAANPELDTTRMVEAEGTGSARVMIPNSEGDSKYRKIQFKTGLQIPL